MSRDLAQKVYIQGGPPPHGFRVALSEDTIQDPETNEPVSVYYLLFKNSEFQSLGRKELTEVAMWLKKTHDAMRSYGLRTIIQPVFDNTEGLTPDQLKYKLQEMLKKK